jgi:5-dehydro-2-deoxygluconokinase
VFPVPERLYVLPCDHRSILRSLWEQHRTPGYPDADAFAAAAKRVVVDGLLQAVDLGLPARWAAVLMDDELGSEALDLAHRSGIARVLPVDVGEVGPFTLQHPGALADHVRRVHPEIAACLIGYNPESPDAGEQLERTRELANWQPQSGTTFLLELQVLPRPQDLGDDGGRAWEAERRPALIAQAIRDLRRTGFDPQVWKLQDAGTDEDYRTVLDAVTEDGRGDVKVVILGAGAEPDVVDQWLRRAATYPECIGFAVGRSVWAHSVEGFAEGSLDAGAAARGIAERYLRFATTFSGARDAAVAGG